ncbi:hypothetical protein FZC74_11055 [Sutcliffiella horikoshii]|uniref:Uncharacterized protein n=1 Tax=Sutcliffiella horikoshii TaxID=79883 RepID=A0AA94WPN8_9BACI|nr:hypothetical protein FZC74_11055 [Sutcliffiella horikoshii]
MFFICSIAVDWSKRRRLLREIALGGDPTGLAEEAPAAPLGKRSHLRKSTAAYNRTYPDVQKNQST